jgi:hypothetical protein
LRLVSAASRPSDCTLIRIAATSRQLSGHVACRLCGGLCGRPEAPEPPDFPTWPGVPGRQLSAVLGTCRLADVLLMRHSYILESHKACHPIATNWITSFPYSRIYLQISYRRSGQHPTCSLAALARAHEHCCAWVVPGHSRNSGEISSCAVFLILRLINLFERMEGPKRLRLGNSRARASFRIGLFL